MKRKLKSNIAWLAILLLIVIIVIFVLIKYFKSGFVDSKVYKLDEPFVFQNIYGGLGNQFFQIYNGISYALDNNKSYYFNDRNGDKRPLYWDSIFTNLKSHTINPDALQGYRTINISEQGFHYSPLEPIDGNCNISGYYQSEKYFKHNFERVNDIIGIRKLQNDIRSKYWASVKQKYPDVPIISLQIGRAHV